MDVDHCGTPQEVILNAAATLSGLLAQNLKSSISGNGGFGSPNGSTGGHRKPLHPRTPNASQSTNSSSSVHSLSNQMQVGTPPAKRFQRVRNPFEAALTERLHLPLIASPSLFQRPATPQLCSTQLEWTIEEVSSLQPAHVEPHETQFHDSPDPEYEAKAQLAISSYFREQQIVPSPVDCPLRSRRIILSELNGNTPISKPGRRIRECGTQTELTLPAVLPKHLEEALAPFFQPQLAINTDYELSRRRGGDSGNERTQFCDWSNYCASGNGDVADCKDTSLRRKLFDMQNIILLDDFEHKIPLQQQHPNTDSPAFVLSAYYHTTAINGKLSDSLDKSSFGSLSPISATEELSISPNSPFGVKRKSRIPNFIEPAEVELSPIHPPVSRRHKSLKTSKSDNKDYRSASSVSDCQSLSELSNKYNGGSGASIVGVGKFTPDRSSSPLNCLESAERSIDSSFNNKISRLVVNSAKSQATAHSSSTAKSKLASNGRTDIAQLFLHDDTDDMLDDVDDEDMQMSQLSAQSSNCSSSNSDTPRCKRRSASRKNLSQSFSNNWLDDDDDEEQQLFKGITLPKLIDTAVAATGLIKNETNTDVTTIQEQQRVLFYRADSGFNEMTSSQSTQADEQNTQAQLQDISMVVCSSTPSKQSGVAF